MNQAAAPERAHLPAEDLGAEQKPVRLTESTAFHSASDRFSSPPGRSTAAALTSTPHGPSVFSMGSDAAATLSGSRYRSALRGGRWIS